MKPAGSPQFKISFRPIAPADVPNLVRWQREAEVAIWWGQDDKTEEELVDKWVGRTSGTGTPYEMNTRRFVIVVDGTDIGEIQA